MVYLLKTGSPKIACLLKVFLIFSTILFPLLEITSYLSGIIKLALEIVK